MSRRQPFDIVHTTRRGVVIRYSPSQGSSVRYRITCPHGKGVNARTVADAREDARHPEDWCDECTPGVGYTREQYEQDKRARERSA